MKHEVFAGKNVEPSGLYEKVKTDLLDNGFKIEGEDKMDKFWDLRAKKTGLTKIVSGTIRDADVIIAGVFRNISRRKTKEDCNWN